MLTFIEKILFNIFKSFPDLTMIGKNHKNVCEQHVVMAWMRRVWKGTVVPLVGVRTMNHLNGLLNIKELAKMLTKKEIKIITMMSDSCKGKKKRKR